MGLNTTYNSMHLSTCRDCLLEQTCEPTVRYLIRQTGDIKMSWQNAGRILAIFWQNCQTRVNSPPGWEQQGGLLKCSCSPKGYPCLYPGMIIATA